MLIACHVHLQFNGNIKWKTNRSTFLHMIFLRKKNNYVCVVAGEAHTKFMPKVDHSAHRQKVQTLKGYKSSCNYAEQLFKKWKLLLFNYTFWRYQEWWWWRRAAKKTCLCPQTCEMNICLINTTHKTCKHAT